MNFLSIGPDDLYTILNENPKLQPNLKPSTFAHAGRAVLWVETEFQIGHMDLALIFNFHSVWYRDHLVQ